MDDSFCGKHLEEFFLVRQLFSDKHGKGLEILGRMGRGKSKEYVEGLIDMQDEIRKEAEKIALDVWG